jgi:hypothetical protein
MDKKEFQNKVAETAFWVAISPFVSVLLVLISISLGVIEGGRWFLGQTYDYVKTIERIWTS